MNIVIISGGSVSMDTALRFFRNHKTHMAIAVDGGLEIVQKLEAQLGQEKVGLKHVVGDFDTVNQDVLKQYKRNLKLVFHQYVAEKDYTDTDIALKLAVELIGSTMGEIYILGATGTRLDHVLANIQMLKLPMESNISCKIIDDHNQIRMFQGTVTLNETYGKYVSIIPISNQLKGITLTGFKYPLDNQDTSLGESLCVSNQVVEFPAVIEIKEGTALLIESLD